MPSHKILFLCTGNYYRSRFAEELFNHLARQKGLAWTADSRGLARIFPLGNVGPLSKYTAQELEKRGIQPNLRMPQKLHVDEARQYQIVIALDEQEHRPYIQAYYPHLTEVIYWDIKDLGDETSASALGRIEKQVTQLIAELS